MQCTVAVLCYCCCAALRREFELHAALKLALPAQRMTEVALA
jgi:hypothetical protein